MNFKILFQSTLTDLTHGSGVSTFDVKTFIFAK